MMPVGIENISVYPGHFSLDLSELAQHRGADPEHLKNVLMVTERSLNPTWEDPVTMAVNAALPLLKSIDRTDIELLIVCTESGLDLEKPLSSWVHRYLGLASHCRHFELKCACYSGTAALKMAAAWIASNTGNPQGKALVITSDQSLISLHKPWEYVNGAGAVAMIVSKSPDFLALEPTHYGLYTHEVSDVIRPLPWVETGNSDDSLFSYMEGLSYAYEDYENRVGNVDFNTYFDYNLYHVPFSGIAFRAHKQLMKTAGHTNNSTIGESFHHKTKPSLAYPTRVGGIYGGGLYLALTSLIAKTPGLTTDQRIGLFSYGSGSCAEFYSAKIGPKAHQIVNTLDLDNRLDQRQSLTIDAYESTENERVNMTQSADFTPDTSTVPSDYRGLIYTGSKGYYRHYACL